MKNRLFQATAALGGGWAIDVYDARYDDYEMGYVARVLDSDYDQVAETWATTIGEAIFQLDSRREDLFPLIPTVPRNALIEEIERARKYRLADEREYMLLGTILKDQAVPPPRLLPT